MKELISPLGLEETVNWIFTHKEGVVLCCTMNEVLMAGESDEIKRILTTADLLTPDGMPLVWYMRWMTGKGQRVYGPDIMRLFLKVNKKYGRKSLFIGDDKNEKFFARIGSYLVLPYKDRFDENDYREIAKKVIKMNPDVIWLGLGAEKQIRMADGLSRNGVKKVIVTVGAAFDFLSGRKMQAPLWMQKSGLEWVFRLLTEPKRLGARYLKISRYVVGGVWRKGGDVD